MTSKADPAAVDSVRSIGKVLGEDVTEGTWEGTTEVQNELVMDVGGNSAQDALSRAEHLLAGRGWEKVSKSPEWLIMKSIEWSDVYVSVNTYNHLNVGIYSEKIVKVIEGIGTGLENILFICVDPGPK
ncbi:hypothetical protein [Planomonospora venezuelensis]|uniref:Uncharacterized protein n=1 Tax=Planomonospora venezuelensis TaxID=1999 RepID=A0A841D0G3_PLAVE|nr:hypothetical protein [Planomonospora venezuelensis]MBB5962014.1 hypothetical protein [Planomonospora venezuelensis]